MLHRPLEVSLVMTTAGQWGQPFSLAHTTVPRDGRALLCALLLVRRAGGCAVHCSSSDSPSAAAVQLAPGAMVQAGARLMSGSLLSCAALSG